jgi:radical SAM protein with 4Fe4S-binding SPASM domain
MALSILSHLTDRSFHEPGPLFDRTEATVAEFDRNGEVLCLEPISGQWAISMPEERKEVYSDLMRKRFEWARNPANDESSIPAPAVTVSVAASSLSCSDEGWSEGNGGGESCLPPEQVLRFIRLVEATYPDRDRSFVFHGRDHLLDWRLFESLLNRYRSASRTADGTTRFTVLLDPVQVTGDMACRLRELGVRVHVNINALPAIRGIAGRHSGSSATFERAIRGCEWLRQAGIHPCIITTIADPADLLRAYHLLRDHGFRQMLVRPPKWAACTEAAPDEMAEFGAEDSSGVRFAAGFMGLADAILDHNRTQAVKVIEYGLAVRISRLNRRNRPCEDLSSPCSAASGNALGLDARGDIFPCGAMFGFPGLALGHLSSVGTAADLAGVLNDAPVCKSLRKRRVENIDRCSACRVQRFCGADCATESYERFGAMTCESARCSFEQKLFIDLLWKVAKDPRSIEWLCPVEHRADLSSSCLWGAFA